MKTSTKLAALTLVMAGLLGTAYAAESPENDASGVKTAAISLTDAVNAAVVQVPGTPSRAEFETNDSTQQALWQVEVVTDKGVMDVEVDATSGQVIKQTADKADQDESENEDGEKAGGEKADKADK